MTYQLLETGNHVKHLPTDDVIPFDDGNRDYFIYKEWLSVGNTPEPAEVQIIYNRYTGKEKFDLFTSEEQRAIAGAAMMDVDVKLFYDRFTAADFITYEDPEMVQGLEFMEQRGFLTPERHAAVIAEMTR
ncbi:hypothetical protein [Comamonas terrigena]|uniref:hypothetical protein n=1 Tax=Comamonas terrigena TaxID=32013 RepID=UPI00244CE37E|nr:hypothetical protein [Comamonas terrigena]MDH1700970.1 hypothetical protein [Comamonas terrigena]